MKVCSECHNPSVKKYKFGGYWCSECRVWFTTQEYEENLSEAKTEAKVKVSVDEKPIEATQ